MGIGHKYIVFMKSSPYYNTNKIITSMDMHVNIQIYRNKMEEKKEIRNS